MKKNQVKYKENQNMQQTVASSCIQITEITSKIYCSVTSIIQVPNPSMSEHATNSKYL